MFLSDVEEKVEQYKMEVENETKAQLSAMEKMCEERIQLVEEELSLSLHSLLMPLHVFDFF